MPLPRKPIWLFDLDNTLHNANRHAFPTIDAAMTRFIADALRLPEAEASQLRVAYWHRHGATLLGLIRHHPHIDPRHFLAYSHPLDELTRQLHPMPGLKRTLARLPGRKYLFTNGPHDYAEAMLAALGIDRCFDGIFAIDSAGYAPKPQLRGYRALLRQWRLDPARCVLVEDSAINLKPARRLGIGTVLIRKGPRRASWADWQIPDLAALAERWSRQR
ncbi:pyrimidine 5'-nucleotidase [Jeongeupia naejangsanensis]|uniref:Pyrimidine 5'-nucleotidase n=1 Tax=Jeongeupia naejangsanensis TaxID=613195 RepID=A0ABS2BPM5_9NEIS|nr:pyrimidine 5'-nucleotidase [Jeongeupia naejangsanensis]MBM3117601.1 pyrimidine 5'-nucleotidase [Jeongeupia naejangsanensis]